MIRIVEAYTNEFSNFAHAWTDSTSRIEQWTPVQVNASQVFDTLVAQGFARYVCHKARQIPKPSRDVYRAGLFLSTRTVSKQFHLVLDNIGQSVQPPSMI
jgi:hypothetical protein